MKYDGKANWNIYITWIFNIEKTLIVFSHVEQPTKSKLVLGRRNEEVSAYSSSRPLH